MKHKILEYDPLLKKYEKDFDYRKRCLQKKKKEILSKGEKLKDFANGHLFF